MRASGRVGLLVDCEGGGIWGEGEEGREGRGGLGFVAVRAVDGRVTDGYVTAFLGGSVVRRVL